MGRTCIAYCRTSTSRQRETETINAQIERCQRLIDRHGLTLLPYGPKGDGWVLDDGTTGTLLDARQFRPLLDDIRAGRLQVDCLVVFSLSRINRVDKVSKDQEKVRLSHLAAAEIKAALLNGRVKVIDEEGENDPTSFSFDIKLLLANEEFKLIRERTMAGKARRLAEGRFAKGGKPPYGYQQVPHNGTDRKDSYKLVPHPEEAPRLRQLLAWFIEGGYTYAARRATEAQIPTPMARTDKRKNRAADWTSCRWSAVSVQHIVTNVRAYLGETSYESDGRPHTLQFDAVIDHTLFAQVDRRRRERTLKQRARFLSTGYAECVCGGRLHNRLSSQRHYARCDRNCGGFRQEVFDAYLSTALLCRLVQIHEQEGTKRNLDTGALDQELSRLQTEIDRVTGQLAEILDLRLKKELDPAVWSFKNEALNVEKSRFVTEKARLRADHEERVRRQANETTLEARLKAILTELARGEPSLDRKRELLGSILQGGRVRVAWGPRQGRGGQPGMSAYAVLTLPPFGALPEAEVRTDTSIWEQMLGPRRVAGFHVDTSWTGSSQEQAQKAALAPFLAAGGVVTAQRREANGDIVLDIEVPAEAAQAFGEQLRIASPAPVDAPAGATPKPALS